MDKIIVLFLLLATCVLNSFSQDTLIFIDGRIKSQRIQLINDEEDIILYRINDKSSRVKVKAYEKEDIFMVIYGNGDKELIYKQDSSKGNNWTVKQMALYIKGGQVAQRLYKTPLTTVTGVALGAASFYAFPIKVVSITEPLAHSLVLGIKRPHYPKRKISNALEDNKYFKYGYIDTAKQKRRKNVVIGGALGVLGAMLVMSITN